MSYCVNCGVELESAAKSCPLCQTRVINPNLQSEDEKDLKTAFSENDYTPPTGIKKTFVAYVVSMFILIPNIVCSLTNAIFYSAGFWSFYINATSALVWVVLVFPFFTKKFRPYLMWAFDTLAVSFYVFFFFVMGYESGTDWYYDTALPIILSSAFLVLIYMIWVRKKSRHWVLKAAHIVADVALEAVIAGSALGINHGIKHTFEIGMIIFTSCLFIIAFLIYCYSSKHMRRWLSKKFFI